jgi:hypothetical protein
MSTYKCSKECWKCGVCPGAAQAGLSRREFLRWMTLGGLGAMLAACAPAEITLPPAVVAETEPERAPATIEDTVVGAPARHVGRRPSGTGMVEIADIGQFEFDGGQVQTVRPEILRPGHFSLFDTLVHLSERGDIELNYHFDEGINTHVIESINGQSEWWYTAHYSAGWSERNVFRMDMYPYKDRTRFRVSRESGKRLADIHRTFQEEVAVLERRAGEVIIPEVSIRSPRGSWTFEDVVVTAHDVRSDVLQPGTVTALDTLLSLRDQGQLSPVKLTWYSRIGRADPVDSYWVEQVNEAEASGGCGFVYETGPREFSGFTGTHIHIPADTRVIVSPEYALWFWICL